jgi:hypothetical protein
VGKDDGVHDRNRWDIEHTVQQHQAEKQPKGLGERQQKHGHSAHQVAEAKEPLRREVPVGILVAEEQADNGGDGEGVECQGRNGTGAKRAVRKWIFLT